MSKFDILNIRSGISNTHKVNTVWKCLIKKRKKCINITSGTIVEVLKAKYCTKKIISLRISY